MRVALNLVFLVPGETGGMETYARELLPRLAGQPDLDVVCLINREAAEAQSGPWYDLPHEVVPVHARSRAAWVRGEQLHVPRMAAALGVDLIHSLASTAPLRGSVPRVTTIHDLNYLLVPEAHFGLRGLGMRVLVPQAARRSRRIIVDASCTRDDLHERLRIDPEKVDVIPLAAPASPAGMRPTDAPELRARLGLGERPVVLCPGARRPHKNAVAVLEALALLDPAERPVAVVTGYATPYEEELRTRAAALGVAADLVLPDWLPAADLEGLYALAAVVAVPSRYEGFGLPVLEAMLRGVPVVISNRASLPEVAGNAALRVDPDDYRALAQALRTVLNDPAEAQRLSAAGRERAAAFSWERTAELTAASYRRALGLLA